MKDRSEPAGDVIPNAYRLFAQGRAMRRKGRPRPELAHGQDVVSDDFHRWLGYGVEMGLEVLRRRKAMDALGVGDP